MSEPALVLDQVTAGYGPANPLTMRTFARREGPVRLRAEGPHGDVVRGVSLAVAPGEMVGVLGPNGAGKSTLLRVATGVLRPRSGRVLVTGRDAASMSSREIARHLAVLPQDAPPVFPTGVLETVLLGRFPWHAPFAFESESDVAIAEAALRDVGAAALRDRDLSSLSGGERQRVLLARALCQRGEALLCDEPTAHLDLRHQAETFGLLARLRDEGRAVVVVTHDLDLAARCCDRLLLLARGEVIALGAPEEVLTAENARTAFGVTVAVRTEGGALHVVRETPELRRKTP